MYSPIGDGFKLRPSKESQEKNGVGADTDNKQDPKDGQTNEQSKQVRVV